MATAKAKATADRLYRKHWWLGKAWHDNREIAERYFAGAPLKKLADEYRISKFVIQKIVDMHR